MAINLDAELERLKAIQSHTAPADHADDPRVSPQAAEAGAGGLQDQVTQLQQSVITLQGEVARLSATVEQMRAALGLPVIAAPGVAQA